MRPVFVDLGHGGSLVHVESVLVVVDAPQLLERGLLFGEEKAEKRLNVSVICAFA